ncbi:MAG: hypothetical protein ABIH49_01220 [archaeon]
MHKKIFHYLSMSVIVAGGFLLLYFSFLWYLRNNVLMSGGMLIMGLIALANFYLHLRGMKKS